MSSVYQRDMPCTPETLNEEKDCSHVILNVRMPKNLVDKLNSIVFQRKGSRPRVTRMDVILDCLERGLADMTRERKGKR